MFVPLVVVGVKPTGSYVDGQGELIQVHIFKPDSNLIEPNAPMK